MEETRENSDEDRLAIYSAGRNGSANEGSEGRRCKVDQMEVAYMQRFSQVEEEEENVEEVKVDEAQNRQKQK